MVLKLVLDIVKMSYHTNNEVSMSRHSKVIVRTDTETECKHYLPTYAGGKNDCSILHIVYLGIRKKGFQSKNSSYCSISRFSIVKWQA